MIQILACCPSLERRLSEHREQPLPRKMAQLSMMAQCLASALWVNVAQGGADLRAVLPASDARAFLPASRHVKLSFLTFTLFRI
jgi:hypothetical protein